tara:strand:- start:599 stop:1657 length:1059 start_codon:yes stop_codon:yes gene_type:complete
MTLQNIFGTVSSVTSSEINLFKYFKTKDYAIYTIDDLGEYQCTDGNSDLINHNLISGHIKNTNSISSYKKFILDNHETADVFFFNLKIIEKDIELQDFWKEEVKQYENKINRVIAEFLASNHLLQRSKIEFDEFDRFFGEKIHDLIQANKTSLSRHVLLTHDRYLGAIISKLERHEYNESEYYIKSLSYYFEEIIPGVSLNYFLDAFDEFKSRQNSFQDRIVAFIDVLGFKNIVNDKSPIKIREIISELKSTSSSSLFYDFNKSEIDFQISYFSDCIVLSSRIDNDLENEIILDHFISIIESLQFQIMRSYECLLRGAISIGKIYHSKDFCFGPALNKAYQLESNMLIIQGF